MMHDDRQDDVAKLVRLAGKRRAVPPEVMARVRAAARGEWQAATTSRRRRRVLWTAAALASAAAIVLAVVRTGVSPQEKVHVTAVVGSAWAEGRKLAAGDDIALGSELETADGGRVAILLASGHAMRIDAATRIRLMAPRSVALDHGAVYVDSRLARTNSGSLVVHSPLGRIEEIGTQFEVRAREDSVRVRLREGAVVVHHDRGAERVEAGSELSVSRAGTISRQAVPAHGADWEWIEPITPLPDLDGQSARAFLEWVARERGLALAFSDEAVARSATETLLGGSIPRLTLDEALDAVLPTCRLSYRIEEGALVVTAAEGG